MKRDVYKRHFSGGDFEATASPRQRGPTGALTAAVVMCKVLGTRRTALFIKTLKNKSKNSLACSTERGELVPQARPPLIPSTDTQCGAPSSHFILPIHLFFQPFAFPSFPFLPFPSLGGGLLTAEEDADLKFISFKAD